MSGARNPELAAILTNNKDEVSAALEARYVEEYPKSRANGMDACNIHAWTVSSIEQLAHVIKTGEASTLTYRDAWGDAVEDVQDPVLTQFASFLSSILFQARVIASLLPRLCLQNEASFSEAVSSFESAVQDIISYNCRLYADDLCRPGTLRRSWDFSSGMTPASEPAETPSKLHYKADQQVNQDNTQNPALTQRERQVLALVVEGKTNGEIAGLLKLSQNTVKNHVAHIFDKFGVNTRTELVSFILRS